MVIMCKGRGVVCNSRTSLEGTLFKVKHITISSQSRITGVDTCRWSTTTNWSSKEKFPRPIVTVATPQGVISALTSLTLCGFNLCAINNESWNNWTWWPWIYSSSIRLLQLLSQPWVCATLFVCGLCVIVGIICACVLVCGAYIVVWALTSLRGAPCLRNQGTPLSISLIQAVPSHVPCHSTVKPFFWVTVSSQVSTIIALPGWLRLSRFCQMAKSDCS